MEVLNIHEREIRATREQVGALIDSLASSGDLLWPKRYWPAMKFDQPLGVGAVGGHGPIRYFVEAHTPGESIKFRFTGPTGFDGYHGYEVFATSGGLVLLRHTLKMKTRGVAQISWPLVFRPLHDALIDDSLALAERSLRQPPKVKRWSSWVRLLRWAVSAGRASRQGKQVEPNLKSPQHNAGAGPAIPDEAPPSHRASSSEKTACAQPPRG
jgi:hypothetical protein